MFRLTLVSVELSDRIKWLNNLRWVFIAFALITIFIASTVINVITYPFPLYLVILILICFNIFFIYLSEKIYHPDTSKKYDEEKNKRLLNLENRIVNFQITFDMLFLSLLIYFSGGIQNPFIFYFIFHMIIAIISLSRRAAYIQASFAVVFMIIIMIFEYQNIIPENYIVKFIPENMLVKNTYFFGIFFSTSRVKSQNFCTVAMFTFSSGECGKRMVGPNEIMSQLGYIPPRIPHSNPA